MMDTFPRIQSSIDFIETHLKDDISIEDIAQKSCYSLYHFQRLFSENTGIPVMNYLKKRRLSKAAYDLCLKDGRVIDIAFDYGFSYEQSFIRSFKKEFGVTPAAFKYQKRSISIYPRISLGNYPYNKEVSPGATYTLSQRKILYGEIFPFDNGDNIRNSVLFKIKNKFIRKYEDLFIREPHNRDIPLFSMIQYRSEDNSEGVFTLALPEESLVHIPGSFNEIKIPLHMHMNSYTGCHKNIKDMKYSDMDYLYWNLFSFLKNQKQYQHDYKIFSTATLSYLTQFKMNRTNCHICIPVVEK